MIGKLKGRATYGRPNKNPGEEKEPIPSAVGSQISSAVMCETVKMVAKSSSHKYEGVSC